MGGWVALFTAVIILTCCFLIALLYFCTFVLHTVVLLYCCSVVLGRPLVGGWENCAVVMFCSRTAVLLYLYVVVLLFCCTLCGCTAVVLHSSTAVCGVVYCCTVVLE